MLLAAGGARLLTAQACFLLARPQLLSWGMKAVEGRSLRAEAQLGHRSGEALCSEAQPALPHVGGGWEPSRGQAVPAAFLSPVQRDSVYP